MSGSPPLYMLHGGLHSSETGSPEMLMELAYRLAVSDAAPVREIRDRLVVLINPVAEPDGRDREVDWFYRFLKGKTDGGAVTVLPDQESYKLSSFAIADCIIELDAGKEFYKKGELVPVLLII